MCFQRSVYTASFAAILLLVIFSCNKSGNSSTAAPMVDTLTQNIYSVDSFSTPTPGTMLAAPFVFTTAAAPGTLLVMNQNGKVLQKLQTSGQALCFKKWVINGQTQYTYIQNDPDAYHIPGVLNYAGYAVITDSNLNEIKRINFLPFNGIDVSNGQNLDVHDFILLSDSHYIAAAYVAKNVSNIPAYLNPAPNIQVVAPIIQEVNNGVVVFQWDGSTDSSFYANSVESNDFTDTALAQDYMHLNSMYLDPRDNNLIVSFRHQDQIIKLSRQTGGILWRLGGKNSDFPLYSDQVFLRQHDVTLTDSNQTLLIFDNGEQTLRPESRIDEFKLDETNKLVLDFKSFDIPEPFTMLMGSVEKYGQNYFIGGGTANYMLEINYVTSQKIIEFKGSQTSYRNYKYGN